MMNLRFLNEHFVDDILDKQEFICLHMILPFLVFLRIFFLENHEFSL